MPLRFSYKSYYGGDLYEFKGICSNETRNETHEEV